MDDLKTIVIQSLEKEGTLSNLKAQLRSRVFQAIEQNADGRTKAQVGFQWQNPNVGKIHESEEAILSAHIMNDFLDSYGMDYTKSVYVPEVALNQSKDAIEKTSKADFLKKLGVDSVKPQDQNEPIIVQMMKQIKAQKEQIAALQEHIANENQNTSKPNIS